VSNESDQYRKLCRLREKKKRLEKRIANLERRLNGRKSRWGNTSYHRNR